MTPATLAALAVGGLAAIPVSVAAHELGHAAAGRLRGVPVTGFALRLRYGAFALRLGSDDVVLSPATRCLVALGGPAASLALAAVLCPVVVLAPAPLAVAALCVGAISGLLGVLMLAPVAPHDGFNALDALLPVGRERLARITDAAMAAALVALVALTATEFGRRGIAPCAADVAILAAGRAVRRRT